MVVVLQKGIGYPGLMVMASGCLTPTDVALSVCEMAVELELSGTTSPRCLLRIALLQVSVIILEMQEERMKEFATTFVFLSMHWHAECWVGFEAVI